MAGRLFSAESAPVLCHGRDAQARGFFIRQPRLSAELKNSTVVVPPLFSIASSS